MCLSCAEGGRRCRDARRLSQLNHADLLPAHSEDRPDVTWSVDGHREPELAELWPAKADTKGPGKSFPQPVVAEAVGTLADVTGEEPQITTDILAAVPPGARASGLAFRLKSPSSLARKIHDRVKLAAASARPKSPAEVASAMTDIVRYTIESKDHDHLVPTAKSAVEHLKSQGYDVVEAEHSYVDGSGYKGLHLLLRSPSGRVFELQVHSEQSQKIKDEVHLIYEEARRLDPGNSRRAELEQEMKTRSASLPGPPGINRLKMLGGIPVERRKK